MDSFRQKYRNVIHGQKSHNNVAICRLAHADARQNYRYYEKLYFTVKERTQKGKQNLTNYKTKSKC